MWWLLYHRLGQGSPSISVSSHVFQLSHAKFQQHLGDPGITFCETSEYIGQSVFAVHTYSVGNREFQDVNKDSGIICCQPVGKLIQTWKNHRDILALSQTKLQAYVQRIQGIHRLYLASLFFVQIIPLFLYLLYFLFITWRRVWEWYNAMQ